MNFRDRFFSSEYASILSTFHLSDLRLVTKSGTAASLTKVAFFSLLPSLTQLLCDVCAHEDTVIILPEASYQEVQEAARDMIFKQSSEKMKALLTDEVKEHSDTGYSMPQDDISQLKISFVHPLPPPMWWFW